MSGNLLPNATYASPDVPLYAKEGGVPIPVSTLISPVTINSSDNSKSATMTVSNDSQGLIIAPNQGDLILQPVSGDVFIANSSLQGVAFVIDDSNNFTISGDNNITITPNSGASVTIGNGKTIFNPPTTGQVLELDVADNGDVTLNAQGSVGFVMYSGDNLTIQKSAGPIGQIYDSVYNPPPSFPQITVLAEPSGTTNLSYSNLSFSAVSGGVYQLQLSLEGVTPVPGTYLQMYSAKGDGTGGVTNFSGVDLSASAVGDGSIQLMSGYFTAQSSTIRVVLTSSGANWTASDWVLQIVRIK